MERARVVCLSLSWIRGVIVGVLVLLFGALQLIELRNWLWGPWHIAFGGWLICYIAWRGLGRVRTVLMSSVELRDHGARLGATGVRRIIRRDFWFGLLTWWSAAEISLLAGVLVLFEWLRLEGPEPLALIGLHACGLVVIRLARGGYATREEMG